MVLSNYMGKTSKCLGVIQVDVVVGTTTRPMLFVVVPTKANYNLLLGREWLHGVGCVPSYMHCRITIWKYDGVVETIEADQCFFRADANHIGKLNFDQKLANTLPCRLVGGGYNFEGCEVSYTVNHTLNTSLSENTKLLEDIDDGRNPMVIMIESDALARISSYVSENKILAALGAKSKQILVVEANEPKISWVNKYGFTNQTTTSESWRMDYIYDDEPFGFQKDPMISTRKMQEQDPLEEVDLGDGTTKR